MASALKVGGGINAISRNIRGCLYAVNPNSRIMIGDNVGISSSCIWSLDTIDIKDDVIIGANCLIMDNDAHPISYSIRNLVEKGMSIENAVESAPVIIEKGVWIGTQSIILKGVKIGEKTVIGAGSVVVSDIPENCIAAGNPCKVVRKI